MQNEIRIERATESDLHRLAPLTAAFRVALKGYKGIHAESDVEAAAAELREYFAADWPIFAARLGETVCGYAVCRVEAPCVWVESLYVLPEYRRQGAATALFRRAEALAASYGEDTVYNCVHPNNVGVIAFLRSMGYSVLNLIEVRKPYAGEALTTEILVGEHTFDY